MDLTFLAPNWFALGDMTACVYILENLGRQTETTMTINVPNKAMLRNWIELSSVFNLRSFKLRHGTDGILLSHKPPSPISKVPPLCKFPHNHNSERGGLCNMQHFIVATSNYLQKTHGYNKKLNQPLTSKLNPLRNGTLVQFDGRTAKRLGYEISPQRKIFLIQKLNDNKKFNVIGGPDTAEYLGEQTYLRGNIHYIASNLLGCEQFVGSDSGVSHLAGALGVLSKIVVLTGCFDCINNYYECYKNTTCYPKEIKIL
jgi:hypothetical protein